jgi:hypothetical protein
MLDACMLKIAMQPMILTTPIGLKSFDFCVQKSFNMSLESIKDLLDIRLMFEKINPAET